jgi:sirohydrochlorin cobaltochelatase
MAGVGHEAIVLFAHGARDARWAQPLLRLQAVLVRRAPQLRVELAYLELQEPGLPATLEALAGQGLQHIRVAPVFWSMGAHAARDLPALVEAFRARHPSVRVEVLPVLAELPGLLEFVAAALAGAPQDGSP